MDTALSLLLRLVVSFQRYHGKMFRLHLSRKTNAAAKSLIRRPRLLTHPRNARHDAVPPPVHLLVGKNDGQNPIKSLLEPLGLHCGQARLCGPIPRQDYTCNGPAVEKDDASGRVVKEHAKSVLPACNFDSWYRFEDLVVESELHRCRFWLYRHEFHIVVEALPT